IAGPITLAIGKIKSSMGGLLKKKSPVLFFSLGLFNGFFPFGLVYFPFFGALAWGTALQGSLYMLLFGMGTIPLMTSVVYSKGLISPGLRQKVRKLMPVFVVLIGIIFIVRGMGLGIPYLSPAPVADLITAEASCH